VRAIDTNILVRAFVQDDPSQSHRAQVLLNTQTVYIPVTVILELEWVLRSRYGFAPKVISDAIQELAILENAVVGEQAAVISAASKMKEGWDFADALHHSLSEGCDDFATFDTTLAKRARKVSKNSPPVVTI
jgi:predicted nucleic-acid-binding protein